MLFMHLWLGICKNVIYPHFVAGKTPLQNGKIKIPMATHRPQAEQVWIQVCSGPGRGSVLLCSHRYRSKLLAAQLAACTGANPDCHYFLAPESVPGTLQKK